MSWNLKRSHRLHEIKGTINIILTGRQSISILVSLEVLIFSSSCFRDNLCMSLDARHSGSVPSPFITKTCMSVMIKITLHEKKEEDERIEGEREGRGSTKKNRQRQDVENGKQSFFLVFLAGKKTSMKYKGRCKGREEKVNFHQHLEDSKESSSSLLYKLLVMNFLKERASFIVCLFFPYIFSASLTLPLYSLLMMMTMSMKILLVLLSRSQNKNMMRNRHINDDSISCEKSSREKNIQTPTDG